MYNIGDSIVYPMHGAGVIVEIETKKILNKERSYYVLDIPYSDMKVMIPTDKTSEIGVRGTLSPEEMFEVFNVLSDESTPMDLNWNKRNRSNMDKLKTGDLKNVAEVVRNLLRLEKDKVLSTGEKKLLDNALQIFISELILIEKMTMQDAKDRIYAAVLQ